MNLNLNIGSGLCVNLVRHVRELDRGQSRPDVTALTSSRLDLYNTTHLPCRF